MSCNQENCPRLILKISDICVVVAPRITDSPVDVTVSVGDTVRLPCRAIGHPVPTVRWTKNGNALPFSPKFTVASTGSLTIVNIQESDQGLFRCTAVNAIQAVSAEARLTVQGMVLAFIVKSLQHL